MTREEAIYILRNLRTMAIRDNYIKPNSGWAFDLGKIIDLLQEKPTLADFLGWEEGREYEYRSGDVLMLENGKIYYKSEGCSSGWCNYAFFGNEIDDLRQAKKIEEPKLKAYHVRDEYSYNCLMKELEEQGYMFMAKSHGATKPTRLSYKIAYGARDYIYLLDGKDIGWSSEEHTRTPHEYEDKEYDIIEYHKEPPKLYAKIKGWELNTRGALYWAFDKEMNRLFTSDNNWAFNDSQKIMTKEEWEKLGIDDSNADFEEVDQ